MVHDGQSHLNFNSDVDDAVPAPPSPAATVPKKEITAHTNFKFNRQNCEHHTYVTHPYLSLSVQKKRYAEIRKLQNTAILKLHPKRQFGGICSTSIPIDSIWQPQSLKLAMTTSYGEKRVYNMLNP